MQHVRKLLSNQFCGETTDATSWNEFLFWEQQGKQEIKLATKKAAKKDIQAGCIHHVRRVVSVVERSQSRSSFGARR